MDAIETLKQVLGLDDAHAEEVLLLTHWIDEQVAVAQYGYPKDNLIPPPMAERLANACYVALLLDEAEADGGMDVIILDALRRHARAVGALEG